LPVVRDPKPSRVQPAVKRAVLVLVALLVPAQLLGKWIYST
jgi:hypothetical protein